MWDAVNELLGRTVKPTPSDEQLLTRPDDMAGYLSSYFEQCNSEIVCQYSFHTWGR